MSDEVQTRLQQNIQLLNSLISKIGNPDDNVLQVKVQFLQKLKAELEHLEEKQIPNVKNVKKLLDFLNSLFQTISRNKEQIDAQYLEQMFCYLVKLERIIDIESNTNKEGEEFVSHNSSFLGSILHFFQNTELKSRVEEILEELKPALEQRGISLRQSQIQLLMIKLKLYLKKHDSIDIPTFADAILEHMEFLDNKHTSIIEILEKHNQNMLQKAAEFRRKVYNENGVQPQVLFEIEDYVLLNLITSEHLEQESGFSGHCVGDSDHYKNKITQGVGEIFSLRKKSGEFCCTIEYDIKNKSILQIRGVNNKLITQGDFFWKILIQFLIKLCSEEQDLQGKSRTVNSIKDIENLIPKGFFLSKRGVKNNTELNTVAPEEVLYGDFKDLKLDFKKYREYISNSKGTFDLTHLKPSEKNSLREITSSIVDKSTGKLTYKKLVLVGGYFDARKATSLSLDSLKSVGEYFNIRSVTSISLNSLETVEGYLDVGSATLLSLDSLKLVVGNLDARNAASILLPALESVGREFYANSATSLSLPSLKLVGGTFGVNSAPSLSSPLLESVGRSLDVSSTTSLSLPSLKTVGGDFKTINTTSLLLPSLKTVGGSIVASSTTSLSLPSLRLVGISIDARSAISLSLDSLESVGASIVASRATPLSLPSLRLVGGSIVANSATSFSLLSLESVGVGIVASRATLLSLPSLRSIGEKFDARNAESVSILNIKKIGGDIQAPNLIKQQIEETIRRNN